MSTASRLACVLSAALVLASLGCGSDTQSCCGVPEMEETDVRFTWTVNGQDPAQACADAGATTARLEVQAFGDEVFAATAPCTDGTATVRATVFAPALGTMSAGVAFARLLDAAGAERTALRWPLSWSASPAAGSVVAAAPALVTVPPGGTLRYRWCEPIPAGGSREVSVDGPMWRSQIVGAGATEAVFTDLAPGSYGFHVGAPGAAQEVVGRVADVVAGGDTVLRVSPCPL